MKKFLWMLISSLLLMVIAGCSQAQVYPTIEAALQAVPPYDLSAEDATATRILQQQPVADGVIVLYSWHRSATNTYGLTTAFVSNIDGGWTPQSSSAIEASAPLLPAEGQAPAEPLQASFTIGGNIRPLSTAYGVSHVGERIRVT